ncbi:MAG TPA: oligosaccharide flippase family protein [Vicinamibacterales bacterium]|nr:oligosaccharide flippase family protein [Vicinamibacterales bacterium]
MLTKLRGLSKSLAIYGLGDAAIQAINFLLLPVYVQYLSRTDYGIIALLAAVEAPLKLLFRWGVDGAFMRFWYEEDQHGRQRLASTLFLFLLAANGILLAAAVLLAPLLSQRLFDQPGYTLALQLVLLNTFAIGFTFIPFHVLRIQNKPAQYSALALARSVATLVGRLVLIVGFGWGVMGIIVTDVVVTAVLLVVLLPWFRPLIRLTFSKQALRESLAFGLPRVPHGFALQLMAVADRFILQKFRTTAEIGLYSMGVSFGLIPKIVLAAFESAWAPFYYATSREPDARRVFATVTTYGVALLALMTAVLAATGRDLLDLMTRGEFTAAAPVVTWTAVGVFFYGCYLLTSIGLNITRNTRYYPVSTMAGAAVNVGLNLALIPGYGMLGAAWANAAAYAVQSAIAFRFSQQFYRVDYERGRLTRALLAAIAGYAVAILLPPVGRIADILVRGMTVPLVMVALLWTTRFFNAAELRRIDELRTRRGRAPARPVTTSPDTTEMAGEIVSVEVPDQVVVAAPEKRR